MLDVTIGLVFVFLLYSLLATSVNEALATALGLRARMLKKGIVEGMLANHAHLWAMDEYRYWHLAYYYRTGISYNR